MFEVLGASIGGFILASILIELSPGPNMAYLAVLGASHGRRAGYAAVAGVALGLLIVGLLTALGLAAVIAASPLLFQTLRWGGVAYLLWLAWEGWFNDDESSDFERSNGRYFRRGLIVNLLNPKAGVFYVAMLPQFVTPSASVLAQTITLSVTFVIIATAIHATIVTAAATLRPLLLNAGKRRRVRRGLALSLVAVAIWLAFKTQA